MISFSTCWNSSRHTAGEQMIGEIKNKLGFELIELGHGIRISLMPGIQKIFERGKCASAACTILPAAGRGDERVARLLHLFRADGWRNASAR